MQRELTFWHSKKPECTRSGSTLINIGLEYFYPALIVLMVGMALSLIILVAENYVFYKQQTHKHKHTPIIVYPFTL